ncbi:MAG: PH domain-containing protein [Peptococcaceae bacterium]|nr:PH domain-containing protein [Peptococcaceae bacterium]
MKKPEKVSEKPQILWRDRKRIVFGLPWSFTKYSVTEEKLFLKTGLIKTVEDEVRLYRIMDVTLKRNLEEKLFGLGTIEVYSADKSMGNFQIKRVKNSKKVRDLLSDVTEKARKAKGIVGREFLGDDPYSA